MNSHEEYGQAQLECCAEDAERQVETAVCCGCKGKLLGGSLGRIAGPVWTKHAEGRLEWPLEGK